MHWEPIFQKEYAPKLSMFFLICFGFNCFVFGLIAPIVSVREGIFLGLLFGLFALGFGLLARTCWKSNQEHSKDLNDIINGKYEVAMGQAYNLEVMQFTTGSSHTEEQYAYVDIFQDNGNILIENVEIPFSLGKVLLERRIDHFPCLLIHINNRKEMIALPKFK